MIQKDLYKSEQVLRIKQGDKQRIKIIWIDDQSITQEKINQNINLQNQLSEKHQGITIETEICQATEYISQDIPAILIINTEKKKRRSLQTSHQCFLKCDSKDHNINQNWNEFNNQVNRVYEDLLSQIKFGNLFNPPCIVNNQYSHSNCANLALYLTLQECSKQHPTESQIMEQLFQCCNDYGQRILLETELQNKNFENVFEKIMYCYQKKAIFQNLNSKFAQNDFYSISHLACVLFKGFQESQDDDIEGDLYRSVSFEKERDYLEILESFEKGWENNQLFSWNTIIRTTQNENVTNQEVQSATFGIKFIIKLDQYNQHPYYQVQTRSGYFSEGDILLYPQFTFRCKKIEGFLNHTVIQIKQSYESSGFTLNYRLRKRFWQAVLENEVSPALSNIISHLRQKLDFLILQQDDFLNFDNFAPILNQEVQSYFDKIQQSLEIFLKNVPYEKLLTNVKKINEMVKKHIVFIQLNNQQQLADANFILNQISVFYTNSLIKVVKHEGFEETIVLRELSSLINQVSPQIFRRQPNFQSINQNQSNRINRTLDSQPSGQVISGTPQTNIQRSQQVIMQRIENEPQIPATNNRLSQHSSKIVQQRINQEEETQRASIEVIPRLSSQPVLKNIEQQEQKQETQTPESNEDSQLNDQFSTQNTEQRQSNNMEISDWDENEAKRFQYRFESTRPKEIKPTNKNNNNITQVLSQNLAQQLSHESVVTSVKKEIQSRNDKFLYQEKKQANDNLQPQINVPKPQQKQTPIPNKPNQQTNQKNLFKKQHQQFQQKAYSLGAVGATTGSIIADMICEGPSLERQGPQAAIGLIQFGLPALMKNSKILNLGYGFSALIGVIEIGGVFLNDRLSDAEKIGKTVKLVAGTASAIGIQATGVYLGFAVLGFFGAFVGGVFGGFAGYFAKRVINYTDQENEFQISVSFTKDNYSELDAEDNLIEVGLSPTIRVYNLMGKMRTLIIYGITENHLCCLIVKRLSYQKDIYISKGENQKDKNDEFLFYLGPQKNVHHKIKYFAVGIEESNIDTDKVLKQLYDEEFKIIATAQCTNDI